MAGILPGSSKTKSLFFEFSVVSIVGIFVLSNSRGIVVVVVGEGGSSATVG